MLYIISGIAVLLLILLFIALGKYFSVKEENLKYQERIQELESEKQKLVAEKVKFIMNPHSMRNSLNSIDGMVKKTMKSVENLTQILDYMLYDGEAQFVTVKEEVDFIKSLFDLHISPLKPTVRSFFEVDDRILNDLGYSKKIAPKIFTNYLENAFKHGNVKDHDFYIHVSIRLLNDDYLEYQVKNSVSHSNNNKKGGHGNRHFEEILNSIYKTDHKINYTREGNVYTASLIIKLYDQA